MLAESGFFQAKPQCDPPCNQPENFPAQFPQIIFGNNACTDKDADRHDCNQTGPLLEIRNSSTATTITDVAKIGMGSRTQNNNDKNGLKHIMLCMIT